MMASDDKKFSLEKYLEKVKSAETILYVGKVKSVNGLEILSEERAPSSAKSARFESRA